ncbi:MAG: hypothetical protein FWG39_01695 [Alphaproteobacteria bacterium]|nr:hypothetical protein [Alphaproteobacteria bacterium]
MHNIKKFFDAIFPFAVTILLWRIANPFWNPNGIISMVPIFYYSFIRPRPEFMPMAVLGCLLLDYNFDTMLFWTAMFCAVYAANYLQTTTKPILHIRGGLFAFALFAGACLLILAIWAFTWRSLWTAIWMFAVATLCYAGWAKTMGGVDRG